MHALWNRKSSPDIIMLIYIMSLATYTGTLDGHREHEIDPKTFLLLWHPPLQSSYRTVLSSPILVARTRPLKVMSKRVSKYLKQE